MHIIHHINRCQVDAKTHPNYPRMTRTLKRPIPGIPLTLFLLLLLLILLILHPADANHNHNNNHERRGKPYVRSRRENGRRSGDESGNESESRNENENAKEIDNDNGSETGRRICSQDLLVHNNTPLIIIGNSMNREMNHMLQLGQQ
jgi:hypothetical protein